MATIMPVRIVNLNPNFRGTEMLKKKKTLIFFLSCKSFLFNDITSYYVANVQAGTVKFIESIFA